MPRVSIVTTAHGYDTLCCCGASFIPRSGGMPQLYCSKLCRLEQQKESRADYVRWWRKTYPERQKQCSAKYRANKLAHDPTFQQRENKRLRAYAKRQKTLHPEQWKKTCTSHWRKYKNSHLKAYQNRQAKAAAAYRVRNAATLAERRIANAERRRAHDRQYSKERRLSHPEIHKAKSHKRRAFKKGNGGSWTPQEWIELCIRFGWRCLCCGKCVLTLALLGRKLIPDHVVALRYGGKNHIGNLQPLCHGVGGCNNTKGTMHMDYRWFYGWLDKQATNLRFPQFAEALA